MKIFCIIAHSCNVDIFCISGELGLRFSMAKPRIIFCDSKNAQIIQAGAKEVGHDMEIVVFDDDFHGDFTPFKDFIQETGTEDNFQCV